MIIDANVLVFLHVVHPAFTPQATRAVEQADVLYGPAIWRSELRSAFVRYVRAGKTSELPGSELTLDTAIEHMADAERVISKTFSVDSESVLRLADRSGLSPYDCEYVQLANEWDTELLTYDEPVLDAFPGVAVRPEDFIREE